MHCRYWNTASEAQVELGKMEFPFFQREDMYLIPVLISNKQRSEQTVLKGEPQTLRLPVKNDGPITKGKLGQ